jgi:hypothetical protein
MSESTRAEARALAAQFWKGWIRGGDGTDNRLERLIEAALMRAETAEGLAALRKTDTESVRLRRWIRDLQAGKTLCLGCGYRYEDETDAHAPGCPILPEPADPDRCGRCGVARGEHLESRSYGPYGFSWHAFEEGAEPKPTDTCARAGCHMYRQDHRLAQPMHAFEEKR